MLSRQSLAEPTSPLSVVSYRLSHLVSSEVNIARDDQCLLARLASHDKDFGVEDFVDYCALLFSNPQVVLSELVFSCPKQLERLADSSPAACNSIRVAGLFPRLFYTTPNGPS